MKSNPGIARADDATIFKTRGPLDPVSDSAICAPRPELEQLLRAAQTPTVDAYLALLSSRQTGKTTLLYQLRARLRPRGFGVALVDLSVVRNQPEPELYRYVASQINSELELVTVRLPGRRSALPCSPIEFRDYLFEIARQSPAPRLVILIDEVEAVSGKHSDAFFGTIRNIFSSRRKEEEAAFDKFLFIVSGSKELHRLSTGPNSPLNICERVYLQDLTLAGVRLLVSNFSRAAIAAPPETAQWIFEQTSGHPYLTQKLCQQIELLHPGVITADIVQRATNQLLKSDDHLEKMILQIDEDLPVRETLGQIVSGTAVTFSRLQPAVARLELLGAIRDAGQCAIRNPIYSAALRSHFNLNPASPGKGKWWSRPRLVILAIAVAFFLLNLPFLFNYLNDFYWTPTSINDKFTSPSLNSDFTIHYDRVLRANSPDKTDIAVDWDGSTVNGGMEVFFQPDRPDLILQGAAQRTINQPFQQVLFTFTLNQSGLAVLRYNPFNPWTEHRKVMLVFQPSQGGTRETYVADFIVDYNSAFIFSAVISIASFIGGLGAIFGKVGYAKQALRLAARYVIKPT